MSEAIDYDLLVIGGGINGCGIARDGAGRGLRVALVEKDDLASHTSSASTKLIHGGLRYLEHYEFSLVRKSLKERDVLLKVAPHIVWPMEFILPHVKGMRPMWMLRLGLFLYDHLHRSSLIPKSSSVRLDRTPWKGVLKPDFTRGLKYWDCWADDARLVVLNAVDAHERGADIFTHTECTRLQRSHDHWRVTVTMSDGSSKDLTAGIVVNAAGPWAGNVDRMSDVTTGAHLKLVKGEHAVFPKFWDGDQGFVFQNRDGRIIFALPFQEDFTLIGTTDQPVDSPEKSRGTIEGLEYLLEAVSHFLPHAYRVEDLVGGFSGIRPLYDDGGNDPSKLTRDYVLHLDQDAAPYMAIYGGKLTTYRKLGEEVFEKLSSHLKVNQSRNWTATVPLPGGDMENGDFSSFLRSAYADFPWVDRSVIERYARSYGTRLYTILKDARRLSDLGRDLGGGVYERELNYLIDTELVTEADDILKRLSTYVYAMTEDQIYAVLKWFNSLKK